jgi:hypothetical protein
MFEVVSGIPIPPSISFTPNRIKGGERIRMSIKKSKYPWDMMGIGDSFLALGQSIDAMRVLVRYRTYRHGDRFVCAEVFWPEGYAARVWRVA